MRCSFPRQLPQLLLYVHSPQPFTVPFCRPFLVTFPKVRADGTAKGFEPKDPFDLPKGRGRRSEALDASFTSSVASSSSSSSSSASSASSSSLASSLRRGGRGANGGAGAQGKPTVDGLRRLADPDASSSDADSDEPWECGCGTCTQVRDRAQTFRGYL